MPSVRVWVGLAMLELSELKRREGPDVRGLSGGLLIRIAVVAAVVAAVHGSVDGRAHGPRGSCGGGDVSSACLHMPFSTQVPRQC
jgi:hypothetical protein